LVLTQFQQTASGEKDKTKPARVAGFNSQKKINLYPGQTIFNNSNSNDSPAYTLPSAYININITRIKFNPRHCLQFISEAIKVVPEQGMDHNNITLLRTIFH
jgi:hypothetical protein